MFLNELHNVSEVHFTLKDIGYIAGILVTFLSAWFKLKLENGKQTDKIKALTTKVDIYHKEYREEFLNAKNGRVAIRRDFDANIIANNTVFSARLDTMDKDLKEMYRALNKMNVNLTEVKAKLDIMINKK
jgi:hypothetical protein